MEKSKLPKSLRKHIRLQKARIRREIGDVSKQKEQIKELMEGILSFRQKKK